MNKIFILFLFFPFFLHAQGSNDLVQLYLAQNNVSAPIASYRTCNPSPNPVVGTDGLCDSWNVPGIAAPTVSQLQALIPTYQNAQAIIIAAKAAQAQYSAQLLLGLTVSCATNATVCTSSITGTYTVGSTNPPTTPANIAAQTNITDISDLITAGALPIPPNTTFSYLDSAGAPHQFTSAQWAEFKVAMGIYSYQLNITYATLAAGGSASFPSNTITLN